MPSHYRIDRISSIKISDEEGKRDDQFNVYDYLRKTWNMFSGPETKVRIKFKSFCRKVVTELNLVDGVFVDGNDDYFIYDFNCHGTAGIKLWLMGFGPNAEVLEPVELREQIKNDVEKMVELYKAH